MSSASPSMPWHRSLPSWAWVIIAATMAGLFFGAQYYYLALARDRPVQWLLAFRWSFGDWYGWAILSPIVFWICSRLRFDAATWPRCIPAYVAAALALAFVHAVLCAAGSWLVCIMMGLRCDVIRYTGELLVSRTPFNLAVFFIIVCAWHAWHFYQRFRGREETLAEMERELAAAQLFALRMQLNPHFLFNTLNTISSLTLTDVRAANQMISRLGSLLREVLQTEHEQEVALSRELELATRYLDIERVRFGERLSVCLNAPTDVRAAAVPTFVLQPLIENAIRHALERRTEGGKISLQFSRSEDALFMRVSDDGPAPSARTAGNRLQVRRESIGLGNTRQRLEKLYGRRQWLRLDENAEGGVTVEIMIPFRLFGAEAI